MRIAELFARAPERPGGREPARRASPTISFEFFPPKTEAGYESLFGAIVELKQLDPAFVSVTWGAGGSTRRKTVELVERIQRETGITAMAHLTCVGAAPADLEETLARLATSGIENVLALGGDEPAGYAPPPGTLRYASELVSFIRARGDFCLGAACYPETHRRAASPEADLAHLLHKVQCGVDFLITNFFFDPADYSRFCERARRAGISVPIIPGIMPVVSARGIRRMAELSGARLPDALLAELARCGEDDARIMEVGIDWAIEQCAQLLREGAPGLHFYTLNRSPATRRVHRTLFPA
jgi:methylenetetrahydrofolate reductase (NADPH)